MHNVNVKMRKEHECKHTKDEGLPLLIVHLPRTNVLTVNHYFLIMIIETFELKENDDVVICELWPKMLIFGLCTVKPVYNDHPRDLKFIAVVVRWS